MRNFNMKSVINNMVYFVRNTKEIDIMLITGTVVEMKMNTKSEAEIVEDLLLKKDTETILDITVKSRIFRGYS